MTPRDTLFFDDLADVMRRARHGLIRPLWADLPVERRVEERNRAANLQRFLEIHGFTIQRLEPAKDRT